jgi:uncharacterized peroxidase-related enzyme
MSHIPTLIPSKAPLEVRAVYDEFYQRMAFPAPPNFIMTQGHSPTVVRGTWEVVQNVLVLGEIPRWVKELVFVAISNDRQCRYCTAAHAACCRMLGVEPKIIEQAIADVNTIADPRARAMILFALKCSRNPQSLTEKDYSDLYAWGLTESEAVELIAMAGFAVYANIIADATAMDPDEMFNRYNPESCPKKERRRKVAAPL